MSATPEVSSNRTWRVMLLIGCLALCGLGLSIAAMATTTATTTSATPGASAAPRDTCRSWQEGTSCEAWHLQYDGFGTASAVRNTEGWRYSLAPRAVDDPDQTSAALALSTRQFGDLELLAHMRTREQLRRPEGNPWEVAWLAWHYTDDVHFYYVALKPNGWELGKTDPAYPGAQRYLATGSERTFPIGPWYEVEVIQVGDNISVAVDGTPLTQVTDTENPYTGGSVGLYTEDAAVEFENVHIAAL